MTFPDLDDEPRRGMPTAAIDLRVLRDYVGLLLVALGLVGIVVCAFRFDALLGWAVVSAVVLVAGLMLGQGD